MTTIKISKAAVADFNFFLKTDLDLIGTSIHHVDESQNPNPDHHTALACFYAKDTHGIELPCSQPDLLAKARRGKASWNLQIKLWAERIADATLSQDELRDYCHGKPEWIFEAVCKQAAQLCISNPKLGFAPTFTQVHKIKGQWFPPYMKPFDPII